MPMERILQGYVPYRSIHLSEKIMKKVSYVLAALVALAIAAPAVAQDKPMMKEGMGEKPMMHEGMHEGMHHHHMHHMRVVHVHHHYHHHMSMMKKPMSDKM
jgi:ABC-type nickel/cobalt efflux system permease component RcnA